MSKSSEKFLAMREQEQAREDAEMDVPAYREHLYLSKKQPDQRSIKPKQDAHSIDERTDK